MLFERTDLGMEHYFCELAPEYRDQIIARHYFD